MSLVGNLEDLSLGDIMQIISLSQKSGVLSLEGDSGSGRIVFQNGLVHAASVKGRVDDLRGLLVGGGLVEGAAFDDLSERARELGVAVEETIASKCGVNPEQIDSLIQESIESAVVEMFSWSAGDFSFDVRRGLESDDPQILLSSGINAQFLAMEGMRICDERLRDQLEHPIDPADSTAAVDSVPSSEAMFGDEPLETEAFDSADDADVVALEIDDEGSARDILVASIVSREDERSGTERRSAAVAETAPAVEDETSSQPSPESVLPGSAARAMSVVLIDSDVSVLEWVKTTIQDDFARVHVFQQAEQGLARIRQYLIRGELPLVLISTEIKIDPLSGIHGLSDFVARLKTQAARLVVVGLREDQEGRVSATPIAFDGVLLRPSRRQLLERGETGALATSQKLAGALHQILAGRVRSGRSSAAEGSTTKSASLRDLRDTTGRLQEASSRGEILPVVLDFASEIFARAAILIVRAEQVFAIAGRGIAALEVDDPLDSAPPVSLQTLDAGWIRSVLESRKPIQGPPSTPADRDLLTRLGGAEPIEAYLGPIESGGSTIALLYGDQAPGGAKMPDTSGLEVVLQHAGLALDRAALERALWEADAGEG
jgi:DNA-binding response OmpR family regulator